MSALVGEVVPWSGRRWAGTVALVLTAHVALLAWLARKTPTPARTASIKTRIQFGAQSLSTESFGARSIWRDPTLFVLPHPYNFSGEAWLRMEPFPFQMTNQLTEPLWLEDAPERLAAHWVWADATDLAQYLRLVETPAPMFNRIAEPYRTNVIRLTFAIEGDLANRRMISPIHLPEADPGTVPTNCVVGVAVNSDGFTFSEVLSASSGYPSIDTNLLGVVKSARFEPMATDFKGVGGATVLTFGNFVFRWLLVPVVDTNRPPAIP